MAADLTLAGKQNPGELGQAIAGVGTLEWKSSERHGFLGHLHDSSAWVVVGRWPSTR
ncbi:MAG: hypothetical protein WCA35_03920 [Kovacikia sp.]